MNKPRITSRRTVIAAGAALALTGAAIGAAAAQTTQPKPPEFVLGASPEKFSIKLDEAKMKEHRDKYFTTLAGKLGVSREKLETAMAETAKEVGASMGLPAFPLLGPPPGGETAMFFAAPTAARRIDGAELDVIVKRADKPAP